MIAFVLLKSLRLSHFGLAGRMWRRVSCLLVWTEFSKIWSVWFLLLRVVGHDFGILFWKGEEKSLDLVDLKRVMFV